MSRFYVWDQILDAVGAPIPLGKRYFYESGTTTPKTIYTDEALTIPAANPQIADAAGVIGPTYGAKGETYTIEDKTAADVSIRSVDDVNTEALTSDALIIRVQQIASNPLDYGAIGDGVNNESTAVQSALDNATSSGVVDLLGLTFRCDSTISVPRDGMTIRNGTLDFSNCTSTEFIRINGEQGETLHIAQSTVNYLDGEATFDTVSGLSAGDILNLQALNGYVDNGSILQGEFLEIESINGTTVKFQGVAQDTYLISDFIRAYPLRPLENITFEKLKVKGQENASGDKVVFDFTHCRNIRMVNVQIENFDKTAISIRQSFGAVLTGLEIKDGDEGIYIDGPSVNIKIDSCTFLGLNNALKIGGTPTPGNIDGPPRKVTVSKCDFIRGGEVTQPVISVDKNSRGFSLLNCYIEENGNATGANKVIECGAVDIDIKGNYIRRNGTGTPTVIDIPYFKPGSTDIGGFISVSENRIETDGTYSIAINSEAVAGGAQGFMDRIEVLNNFTSTDIRISTDTSVDAVKASAVFVRGNSCQDIEVVYGEPTGAVNLTDLYIGDNTTSSVTVDSASDLQVLRAFLQNNVVSGALTVDYVGFMQVTGGKYGATSITNCIELVLASMECTSSLIHTGGAQTTITGGILQQTTITGGNILVSGTSFVSSNTTLSINNVGSSPINITGCSFISSGDGIDIDVGSLAGNVFLTGNSIQAGDTGVEITGTTSNENITVTGNRIRSTGGAAQYPLVVSITALEQLTITGNVLDRTNDSDACCLVSGTITDGIISGNIVKNGDTGIQGNLGGSPNIYLGPNAFVSQSSARFTGFDNETGYTRAATVVESTALLANASATAANNNAVLAALLRDLHELGLLTTT